MPSSQVFQDETTQLLADHSPLEQDDGVQPVNPTSTPMADLLAKVPNLALLAASFFAASPFISPNVMGGKH